MTPFGHLLVLFNQTEFAEAPINPLKEGSGAYKAHICRQVYIERDDFALEPPKGVL